jgi:hypothetical protein
MQMRNYRKNKEILNQKITEYKGLKLWRRKFFKSIAERDKLIDEEKREQTQE